MNSLKPEVISACQEINSILQILNLIGFFDENISINTTTQISFQRGKIELSFHVVDTERTLLKRGELPRIRAWHQVLVPQGEKKKVAVDFDIEIIKLICKVWTLRKYNVRVYNHIKT